MNISQAAKLADLPVKTVRYYADIGLVEPVRAANGYRQYTEKMIEKLKFVASARRFDFSVEECRSLLDLYENEGRAASDVRQIASAHLEVIDAKLKELKTLRHTLAHLVEACAGDDRPDCPILRGLAGSN